VSLIVRAPSFVAICLAIVVSLSSVSLSSMASPAEVPVKVRVRTVAGEPIHNAYVALVPAWRPWSRPLAESIAEKGMSVLRLPAGSYRLVAGARGFGVSSQGPLSISENAGNDLAVELHALKPVTGSVSDEQGNPIAGVRVANMNGAVPVPLGMVSDLAAGHLGSDWTTTTDDEGSWKLGMPEGTVPLVFTASGRASQLRHYRVSDPAALHVTMPPGAILRLTTDRADSNLVVTLVRQGADPDGAIPAEQQPQLLARWATTTTLTWDSLPDGEYVILAKYPDPRRFRETATKLGTVMVWPAKPRQVRVKLPPAVEMAKSTTALFVPGISRKELGDRLEVFGRDNCGLAKPVDHFAEEVTGGSVIYLKNDGAREPFHALTPDRFIASSPGAAEARTGPNAEPWSTTVHQRANAQLVLTSAEENLHFPAVGAALLRDCGKAKQVTVPVEIREDKLGRFSAPARCRSLVLNVEPFEPVVLEKALQAGDQSLGEFVLRAGGSADVRVTREPGGAVVSGATVRLMAASDDMPDRKSILVAEAVTAEDGWAHFTGVPVLRDLRVVAETPSDETSVSADLRIEPHGRGVVDPLAVPEPATLIVEAKLGRALRVRFPAARVGTILLGPVDSAHAVSEETQKNVADEKTPVRFERLHPGKWKVSAVVSVAGTYSVLEIQEVELHAGKTETIDVTLDPLVFEGHVTAEGKGFVARVAIVDPPGTGAGRLYFNSDENGIFNAVLPERGSYKVEVARLSSQGDVIPIGEVDFSDPARRVEIVVPAGSVTARVRADGRPVAKVMVTATLRRDSRSGVLTLETERFTDSFGEAAFEGMLPGLWIFSVLEREGRAAQKALSVHATEAVDVDLDLHRAAVVEGIVRQLGGEPLPRARVDCLLAGAAGMPAAVTANSNSEGKFVIELEAPAPPSILCSVIGPLGAVDAFKAAPGQPIDVRMPAATATLNIADWGARKSPEVFWLVAPDGRVISLSAVAVKIGRFGSPLTIPALAAGRWNLVRIESLPQWLALGSGMAGSLPTVAEITLSAGATETIHLYDVPDRGNSRLESKGGSR
jgi:hypothetical protein